MAKTLPSWASAPIIVGILLIFGLIAWWCLCHPTLYGRSRRHRQPAAVHPFDDLEMQPQDDAASTRTVVAPIPPLYKKDPASYERLPPGYTPPELTAPTPALTREAFR